MRLPAYRLTALATACLLAACNGTATVQVNATGEAETKGGATLRRSGSPAPGAPSATPSGGKAAIKPGEATPVPPTGTQAPAGLASTGTGFASLPPTTDLIRADLAALTGKVKAIAGVLANNGAQLLGNNGVNLISDKGNGYRLAAVDENVLAGAAVYVVGPDGKPLPGVKPVLTDAEGNYKLEGVPLGQAYLIRAMITTPGGKEAALETIGRATANPAPLQITTASAMVATTIYDDLKGDLKDFDEAKFQAAVAATAARLTASDLPDFADRADIKRKLDKLAAEVAEIKAGLDSLKSKVEELEDKLDEIINGTPKPTPPPTFPLSTLAGSPTQGYVDGAGAAARFYKPVGVVVDPKGGFYVTEFNNHTVRHVDADGTTATYAGKGGQAGHADGERTTAIFAAPSGLAINPDGNLYVAEYGANCIRRINPAGQVTTMVGDGTPESRDGGPEVARLNGPVGMVRDPDNNLFIAEFDGHRIRKLAPNGQLTTVAGDGQAGSVDGTGAAARFDKPYGLAWDPSTATLVVADSNGHTIRRVTREGVVTTIAGTAGATGYIEGKGAAARFWGPIGVAVDAKGVIYVGDTKNARIRRIQADGTVDSISGTGMIGYADGAPAVAQIGAPYLMALDPAGYLVFADYPNHCLRRVKLSN